MVYRISCVCLGNICRSPVAEAVLQDRIDRAGLSDDVEVSSAGTSAWHIGNDMDARARKTLESNGYAKNHLAQQIGPTEIAQFDLVLAMDQTNDSELISLARRSGSDEDTIRLFRSFDPTAAVGAEVPDPYYGGDEGFSAVLEMAERAADGVVEFVSEHLNRQE